MMARRGTATARRLRHSAARRAVDRRPEVQVADRSADPRALLVLRPGPKKDPMPEAARARLDADVVQRVRQTMIGQAALRTTLEASPSTPSVQSVRGLLATENLWRSIEGEFGLLSGAEVADRMGSTAKGRNQSGFAADKRRAGKVLGIERLNGIVYPGFQFADGTVHPTIGSLIAIIRVYGKSERGLVQWLCSPSGYFDGGRPVDYLDDADRVASAAEGHYGTEW